MVSYKCIYCQKKYDHKNNFERHKKNIDHCKDYFEQQITKFKLFNKIKMMNDIMLIFNLIIDNENRWIYNQLTGGRKNIFAFLF